MASFHTWATHGRFFHTWKKLCLIVFSTSSFSNVNFFLQCRQSSYSMYMDTIPYYIYIIKKGINFNLAQRSQGWVLSCQSERSTDLNFQFRPLSQWSNLPENRRFWYKTHHLDDTFLLVRSSRLWRKLKTGRYKRMTAHIDDKMTKISGFSFLY